MSISEATRDLAKYHRRRAGISAGTVARLAFVTDAAVAHYERDGLCFERGRFDPCEEAIARLDKVYLWLSAMPG
ncbi:MAG: hypothetical protein WBY94_05590 [Polyangiaceae bacterium]